MRYVFGAFVLDIEAGEVRRGDERLRLRPKCFDLLVYLVQHRGKLLAKNELLDKVWFDSVVSEATLSRTIAALRAALGDSSEDPVLIETVPRRGYKFVGDVIETAGDIEPAKATGYSLVHKSREYSLCEGEQIIGRSRDVAIPIFTTAASRHHARVLVAGSDVRLEDLGSRNGTFVNGKRVTGVISLVVGDEIEIGGERLILWAPTAETPIVPRPT